MTKAAIVGCSNPLKEGYLPTVDKLADLLSGYGLEVEVSRYLTDTPPGLGKRRAKELTGFFNDPEVKHIFDISGGDLANTVLGNLDLAQIKDSQATFYGYSDLTTILTALAKNGNKAVNFQVRNCLDNPDLVESGYLQKVLDGQISTADLDVTFVRGTGMQGPVYGGNLRCLLKLAGTKKWPDLNGAILLLEGLHGKPELITSLLEQCREMGLFDQVNGILLGTFSELENMGQENVVVDYLEEVTPEDLPIAKTPFVGHKTNAHAIRLGIPVEF